MTSIGFQRVLLGPGVVEPEVEAFEGSEGAACEDDQTADGFQR